jgi:HEPN domain-containing protein
MSGRASLHSRPRRRPSRRSTEHAGRRRGAHSVTGLLEALVPDPAIDRAMLDRSRALDELHVPTRYPNGLPAGATADYYTRAEAEQAIGDAEAIVEWSRGMLPR